MPFTHSVPILQELHTIVKNMRSNASPGLDGLNAAFYKHAWPWISNDVHSLVTDFYTTAFMQPEINQTFITLIPKKMQPIVPQDFRPISPCNVIYKTISKSLADRLNPHLPYFIDHSQSAFIKNRHISSNIIITQEIIHSFTLKSWKQQAFHLKLDLAKAQDGEELHSSCSSANRPSKPLHQPHSCLHFYTYILHPRQWWGLFTISP